MVSLDPKERFCGCGGVGHLESIMGHRAMRLRFLDMEPEEVFAKAREGRRALRGVLKPVASGAGRGVGYQHPYGRAGQVLCARPECGVRRASVCWTGISTRW